MHFKKGDVKRVLVFEISTESVLQCSSAGIPILKRDGRINSWNFKSSNVA